MASVIAFVNENRLSWYCNGEYVIYIGLLRSNSLYGNRTIIITIQSMKEWMTCINIGSW